MSGNELTIQPGTPQEGEYFVVSGIIPGTTPKSTFYVVRDPNGAIADAGNDIIGQASTAWGFFLDITGPTYSTKGTYSLLVVVNDGAAPQAGSTTFQV